MQRSTSDIIVQKLQKHLPPEFWEGKGSRSSFKDIIKQLTKDGILSKKEYDYIVKNERPILIKSRLFYLLSELQSRTVIESTLSNLSSVLLNVYVSSGKREEEAIDFLLSYVKDHLNSVFHPPISSLDEGIRYIIDLINNSKDISRDYVKISELLQQFRDELLELGESRRIVYEIDKLSKKFANLARTPTSKQPDRDKLIEEIKSALNFTS